MLIFLTNYRKNYVSTSSFKVSWHEMPVVWVTVFRDFFNISELLQVHFCMVRTEVTYVSDFQLIIQLTWESYQVNFEFF